MAFDQNVKLTLPSKLVKDLDFQHKRLVAEDKLKQYGLSYSELGHDGLVIYGAPNEVLELAVDHLKQLLIDQPLNKQNKENPECSLYFGKVKWVFFEEKADRIWSHRDELKSMYKAIEVDKHPGLKRVNVVCSFSSYSGLKWKLERLMLRSPVKHPNFNSGQKSPFDKSYNHSLENDKKGQSFGSVQAPVLSLPFQFQCKRILVHLSQGSIVKFEGVDAIVNAANEDLDHIGGVAFSISYAAGHKMNDECTKHVKANGPLKVSENKVTTAGKLPYKGIIHCVGPKWTSHHQKEKCEIQLHQTIVNILHTADKHNFSKIAMPAISAGIIIGVPEDICADVYIRAIVDYSQKVRPSCVTEVHFVDIKPSILLAIKKAYEKWRNNPDAVYFKPSSGGEAGQLSQSMRETKQKPLDDDQIKTGNEQLIKNNDVSSSSNSENDTEVFKLVQNIRGLEVKKVRMIKEKKKKRLEERIGQAEEDFTVLSESRQKPIDNVQEKTRSEQLHKNTGASSSSNSEKDAEVIKLEEELRNLEVKKIAVIQEKRKKLKERIRQAEDDLTALSSIHETYKAGTKREQSNKSTSPLSSFTAEMDREEIELEQKLRELEEKKASSLKERRKKELKKNIKQLEKDLLIMESAGTKQEKSNKSPSPLSTFTDEMDREEKELEQKLRELEIKKVAVLKERRMNELKKKIKQLEKDLLVVESVPPEYSQEDANKCIFCTDVLRNPQKLGCGHELCCKCIGEALEFQEACPVCGIQFGDDVGLSSDALLSWYNSSDFIENS